MESYYGLIELLFSGGVVLGLATYELIRVRRALRDSGSDQKGPGDGPEGDHTGGRGPQ